MTSEAQRKGPSKRKLALLLVGLLIVGLLAATAYYYFAVLNGPSAAAGPQGPSVQELAEKISSESAPDGLPAAAFKTIVDRSFKVAWKRPSIDESRYIPTKYQVEFIDRMNDVVAEQTVAGENQSEFAFDLVGVPNLLENETYWWRVKCLYLDKPTYQFIGGGFTINDIDEPPYPVGSGFAPQGEMRFEALPKYLVFDWAPAADPDPGDAIKSYDLLIKRADGEILQRSTVEPPYQIASKLVAVEDSIISFRVRSVDGGGQKSAWSPEQVLYIRPKAVSPAAESVSEPQESLPPVPAAPKASPADLASLKKRLIPALRLPGEYTRIEDQILFYFKKDPAEALASLRDLAGSEVKPAYIFEILEAKEFPPKNRLLRKEMSGLEPLRLSSIDKIRGLPADVYFARAGIRLFPSDEWAYGDPVELSFLGTIGLDVPRARMTATPRDIFRWQEYIGPSPDYKTPDIYVLKIADSPSLLDAAEYVPDRLFIIETSAAELDFHRSVAVPYKKTALYEGGRAKPWYARVEVAIYGMTIKSDVVEFFFGQSGY